MIVTLEASPLHATLRPLVIECPQCGAQMRPAAPGQERTFDPVRARLRCVGCRKVYQVGILLWQVERDEPEDLQLTLRASLQARYRIPRAVWAGKRPFERGVNGIALERCTCGWDPQCPAHGKAKNE